MTLDTPPPHSQTSPPPRSQTSPPSRSQTSPPPRSQTSPPPCSETSLPPRSETSLPPRSQTTPSPYSPATLLQNSQDNPPIDPSLHDYASTIEDDFSDLTSLNTSQINNLEPTSLRTEFTTSSSSFGFLEPKPKVRRSWIWKHGLSVTINRKVYWQCNHCPPNQPKQYSDTSTKHPIDHLKHHRINEHGQIPSSGEPTIIQQAFGNSVQRIHFNSDLFKDLLLRWMIQSNISFLQVYTINSFI